MSRTFQISGSIIFVITVLFQSGCVNLFASEESIQKQLISGVPLGSSVTDLESYADKKKWRLSKWRGHSEELSGAHRYYQAKLGEYLHLPPLPVATVVHAKWYFDDGEKLVHIEVNKSYDAP